MKHSGLARSCRRSSPNVTHEPTHLPLEDRPLFLPLAIFDLFDERFHRADFEGCSSINVLLEFGELDHRIGRASANYLENIRSVVRTLALEAGLRDPDTFALSWHILMKGSIVQAAEGDHDAAKRAPRRSLASSSTSTGNDAGIHRRRARKGETDRPAVPWGMPMSVLRPDSFSSGGRAGDT